MKACRSAISTTSKRKNGDRHRQREDAERREAEQHHEAAAHEQDQQVAGEDVGEQSHRQRDDPDEVRDHLDRRRSGRRAAPVDARPGSSVFR